jgi:hypothetical protein
MLGRAMQAGAEQRMVGNSIPRPPQVGPKADIARDLIDNGYKLTPEATGSDSKIAKGLSAWGGKIKTQQELSAINEATAAKKGATDLGLTPDTPINAKSLKPIKDEYGRVRSAIDKVHAIFAGPDPELRASLGSIAGDKMTVWAHEKTGAPKEYQDLINAVSMEQYTPAYLTAKIGDLRKQGKQNLGSASGDRQLGNSQVKTAKALEDYLERQLQAQGNPELVADFQKARMMYAKAIDYEAVTNKGGDVDIRGMAALEGKKKLSGESERMANLGSMYPKVAQPSSLTGGVQDLGVTDLAAAAISPRPESVMGAVLGRPLARKALASDWAQRKLVRPPEPDIKTTPKKDRTGAKVLARKPQDDDDKEARYQAWKKKQESGQ